jgi:transposase InsO family protein
MSQGTGKLNAFGRQLLCERIAAGWPVRRAAEALGISRQWAYVLWRRFIDEGERAFTARSRRPHTSPRRLDPRTERRIERARRRRRWGPHRLSWLLGIARSTIYAALRRLGLQRRRLLDPARPPVRRYERGTPGDLVHVDTKKLGRLPHGGGKRFGMSPHSVESKRIGWEYVHVAVDDRTRVAYVERLRAEDAAACAGFLERSLAYFADLGVRVRQVMTDNAFSYVHGRAFQEVMARWGVEHVRTPAYTPRWNGKAEAFIGILLREWAYARPYQDNRARAIALPAFVHQYIHRRPHGELGGLPPMARLLVDLGVNKVPGRYS